MNMLFLGLALDFGCSDKDDSAGEADADTDADTDSDTDADSDTDVVPPCKGQLEDERDGRLYAIVELQANGGGIGDCWMAENLDYGVYLDDASSGAHMTDNKIPEKYCYGYDEANCAEYGALYEWAEAMNYEASDNKARGDRQGACPIGWHLPTDGEWKLLEFSLGMLLEETHLDGWRGLAVSPQLMLNAASGYDATLTGWRDSGSGKTVEQGITAKYWTATAVSKDPDESEAWDRELVDPSKKSMIGRIGTDMDDGLAVRCVRDLPVE
jgi:uncharacterized protein (TIGR02145 family)